MLFHASDQGANAVCILRPFVETCKRCGVSVLAYFTEFFRGIVAGRTDYNNMMPWSLIPATVKKQLNFRIEINNSPLQLWPNLLQSTCFATGFACKYIIEQLQQKAVYEGISEELV